MKGLLYKDYCMIAKYCRTILLVIVIFLAAFCMGDASLFMIAYPALIVSLLPVTLLSYEERDRWNLYSGTLPYTKAQLVSSKYLLGLLNMSVILIVTTIVNAIRMAAAGAFSVSVLFSTAGFVIAVYCIAPALVLPFVFRLGTEKGRLAYYAVLILLCIFTFSGLDLLPTLSNFRTAHLLIWIIPGALLLYTVSWLLSIRIYPQQASA